MANNFKKLNTTKVTTPHAAVKIWNYRDRVGIDGLTFGIDDIDQVIISTVSLLSISTTKTKSQPSGNFELMLAPTKNWVKTLTPGSWLVIMISNNPITEDDFNVAHADKVKFFGRIDSVEVSSTIDENGTFSRVYRVSGSDWAQIFNSILYVDPVARDLKETAISVVGRFIYDKYVSNLSRQPNLPSSTDNIKALIDLWGKTNTTFQQINEGLVTTSIVAKPEIAFSIPQAVSNYFNFRVDIGDRFVLNPSSNKLTELIHIKAGKLRAYDDYDSSQREAIGIIKPDCIFGAHTFWQVLMDNSNHVLNEMVADIRWESNNNNPQAELTLYKRIKPFIVRSDTAVLSDPNNNGTLKADTKIVSPLISKFSDIRRITIPLENVVSIGAGSNWRDKYNYAEIQVDKSYLPDGTNAQIKSNNAIYDKKVFGREGFKPMILQTKYLPARKDGSYDFEAIYNWKFLLKEWYFDIHNLLNGTMVFTGINEYIQVGDNVLVKAEVLGIDNNLNRANINNNNTYLLAHVESISHSFTLNPEDSTRIFMSTVQFVRGIITDENGQQFTNIPDARGGSGMIDQDAKALRFDQEDNSTAISSSGKKYPNGYIATDKSGNGGGDANN